MTTVKSPAYGQVPSGGSHYSESPELWSRRRAAQESAASVLDRDDGGQAGSEAGSAGAVQGSKIQYENKLVHKTSKRVSCHLVIKRN